MKISVSEWASRFHERRQDSLTQATVTAGHRIYLGVWDTIYSRLPLGENIYDREWDALLVLDACRVDALRAVANEYEFFESDDVEAVWSVGTRSEEWYANTFTEQYREEIEETALVSANGYTESVFGSGDIIPIEVTVPFAKPNRNPVSKADFALYDPVWEYGRSDTLGVTPPRVVTDRAIEAGRNEYGRLVVHYIQPHSPYLAGAIEEDRPIKDTELNSWDALERGELTPEELWEMYLDNLRLALDEVRLVLNNIDAETVAITADHGELFGEAGLAGHPAGIPHPTLLRVPWVETTATNSASYEPSMRETEIGSSVETELEEQLDALGYL